MKCFDAEKLHSRLPASIFRFFVVDKTMNSFRYLDRMHPQELSGSLSYIFTIQIPLRHNPKYTLRDVIIYHYLFLFSKAYQNRYLVIGIGPGIPGSKSWFVDLEVFGPGSRILGLGSRVSNSGSLVQTMPLYTNTFALQRIYKGEFYVVLIPRFQTLKLQARIGLSLHKSLVMSSFQGCVLIPQLKTMYVKRALHLNG